jgi:putative PIN family toxin of toxin-antitoxin system
VNGIFRVVFDTNILFSSVGWQGNPYRCVQAARRGQCRSLTCEAILAELAEKLRFKRGLDAAKADEVLEEIRVFSQTVQITGTLKAVAADPDDDPVVECAVVGQAKYIVSGDRHLLALGSFQGIQLVNAAQFLKLLESAPAA